LLYIFGGVGNHPKYMSTIVQTSTVHSMCRTSFVVRRPIAPFGVMPNNNNRKMNSTKLSNRRNSVKSKRVTKRNQNKMVILNEAGRFAPSDYICILRWVDQTTVRTNTGNPAMNWRIRSSAFDPDPVLGTGAIPGFAELANLYASYKVLSMEATVQMANFEASNVILAIWPSIVGLNVNSLALADVLEYSANPRAERRILGTANAQNRATVNSSAVGKVLEGSLFRYDPNYTSSTSGNPNAPYYFNIALAMLSGNFTVGIQQVTTIDYRIRFFNNRQLES